MLISPSLDVSLLNLMYTGGRSPGSLAKVIVVLVPPRLQTLLSPSENLATIGENLYSAASD